MNKLNIFIACFFFTINSVWGEQVCQSKTTDLAILKTTIMAINLNDPSGDLKQRLANKDYRFLGLYGLGPEYPALKFPEDKELLCSYGEKMLEGTSDSLESEEHAELVIILSKYANSYNTLLKEYLKKNNVNN